MDTLLNLGVGIIGGILDLVIDYPAFSIPAFLFLILGLYWRQTGRFPVIGFIVRLLYLPINLLALVLFVFGKAVNTFLDLLDMFTPLKGLTFLLLIILGLENGYFFLLAAVLAVLLRFGLETEPLREKITYYPRAKRKPSSPPPRKEKPRREVAPPPPGKPSTPAPPPIVAIAAAATGNPYPEKKLIELLPAHLRELVASSEAEPEATSTPGRTRRLKLLLRFILKLLLFPLTVLWYMARPRPQPPEPEPEAQQQEPEEESVSMEPLTSEATSNE